jgi:hypothetical protein
MPAPPSTMLRPCQSVSRGPMLSFMMPCAVGNPWWCGLRPSGLNSVCGRPDVRSFRWGGVPVGVPVSGVISDVPLSDSAPSVIAHAGWQGVAAAVPSHTATLHCPPGHAGVQRTTPPGGGPTALDVPVECLSGCHTVSGGGGSSRSAAIHVLHPPAVHHPHGRPHGRVRLEPPQGQA